MQPAVTTASSSPWVWRRRFFITAGITVIGFFAYFILFGLGVIPASLRYQPAQQSPAKPADTVANLEQLETVADQPKQAHPTRITASTVGIDTRIQNPTSQRPAVLNDYLAESAVRYPASGYPGNGNMFVFGHSTGRDTVWNQAYKTFNRLENLAVGDEVVVHTESGKFHYTVRSVTFKEDSQAYVPFGTDENLLTIATCDSFGSKEDRVVVRAEFVNYTPEPPSDT